MPTVPVKIDHVALQAVEHHLGHLAAGQGGLGAGVDAVEQADVGGLADGGHLPVGVEVGLVLEVTQSLQDHQGGLSGGHLVLAAIQAVADAGGHALSGTGGHVGGGPGGHVGEGIDAAVVVVVQVQQLGHDDGHLVTSDQPVRVELVVSDAGHDANFLEHLDGFHVVLGSHVVVAHSAGADDHQTQGHDGGQSQAESPLQVSHSEFLLLRFLLPISKSVTFFGIFSHIQRLFGGFSDQFSSVSHLLHAKNFLRKAGEKHKKAALFVPKSAAGSILVSIPGTSNFEPLVPQGFEGHFW